MVPLYHLPAFRWGFRQGAVCMFEDIEFWWVASNTVDDVPDDVVVAVAADPWLMAALNAGVPVLVAKQREEKAAIA